MSERKDKRTAFGNWIISGNKDGTYSLFRETLQKISRVLDCLDCADAQTIAKTLQQIAANTRRRPRK